MVCYCSFTDIIGTYLDGGQVKPELSQQPIQIEGPNQLQPDFKQQEQQLQPQQQEPQQQPQQLPQQQQQEPQPQQQQPQNQPIRFEDTDQFEGFDLVEPQTEQEQQQEQQQQEQLANGCFIQRCDQTITGRQLLYSR